jgi:hypothetical protein
LGEFDVREKITVHTVGNKTIVPILLLLYAYFPAMVLARGKEAV